MATQQPPSRLIPGRPPRYPAGTTFNLATGQEDALDRAIRADPQALDLLKNKPGGRGIYLDATDLRSIGYDVPDNATFVLPYRAPGGTERQITLGSIDDKFDSLAEKVVRIAGGAMLGYGGGQAIGALTAGGPAATTAGQAATAAGTGGSTAGTAAGVVADVAPNIATELGIAGAAELAGTAPSIATALGTGPGAAAFSGPAAATPTAGTGFTPTVVMPESGQSLATFAGTAEIPSATTTPGLLPSVTGPLSMDPDITGYQPPSGQGLLSSDPDITGYQAPPSTSTMKVPENFGDQVNRTTPQQASGNSYKDFLDKYGEDIAKTVSGLGKGAGDERANENIFNRSRDSVLAQIARDQALFDLQNAQSTFDRNLQGAESLYDRNRQQQRDIFGAGMDTAGFARENQSREMRQAMLSGLIGGAEDFKVTGMNPKIAERMPTSTGGARPSMFAGSRDSILATLGRPQVQAPTYTPPPGFAAPAPYTPPGGYKPPTLSEYERAGKTETGLNFLGLGLKLQPWKWGR